MKTGTVDMIEGTEAWNRFREAAKKMISVPKSAVENPFGKRKKKKPSRKSESVISDVSGVQPYPAPA
jgi:hypothetical protein